MFMFTPEQYREFSRDCLRGIEQTDDPKHRQGLLEAAKMWTYAAFEIEGARLATA